MLASLWAAGMAAVAHKSHPDASGCVDPAPSASIYGEAKTDRVFALVSHKKTPARGRGSNCRKWREGSIRT